MVEEEEVGALAHDLHPIHLLVREGVEVDDVAEVDQREEVTAVELKYEFILGYSHHESEHQTAHHEPEWIEENTEATTLCLVHLKTFVKLAILRIELLLAHRVQMAREEGPDEDGHADNDLSLIHI